jgi:hypothetical protein
MKAAEVLPTVAMLRRPRSWTYTEDIARTLVTVSRDDP